MKKGIDKIPFSCYSLMYHALNKKLKKNGKHLTKIKICVILLLENEKENSILIFV